MDINTIRWFPAALNTIWWICKHLCIHQLKRLEIHYQRRNKIWNYYTEKLLNRGLILPPEFAPEKDRHGLHLYTVLGRWRKDWPGSRRLTFSVASDEYWFGGALSGDFWTYLLPDPLWLESGSVSQCPFCIRAPLLFTPECKTGRRWGQFCYKNHLDDGPRIYQLNEFDL